MTNKKKKVLLIKLSSLGDVIFNIPLANSLKKADYEVSWLVSEKGVSVLRGNPCVDKVILAPFVKWKKSCIFSSIKEYFSILRAIRKEKYDVVIDTQGRWKSLVFSLFSGSKKRLVGSDSKEFSRYGGNEIVEIPTGWELKAVEKYLLFGKKLGIETNPNDVTLPESEETDINTIENLLNGIDYKKPIVVICPATTWVTKHWNKDNWKSLCEKLDASDKYNLIYTGMQSDYDYIEYINCGKNLNLAGKTSLNELIVLFRKSNLIISLDSGSTHLAWASGAKHIISIFCSTPEKYYAPIGENHIALAGNLACRPCHKRHCKKSMECTKVPMPEEVLKLIEEIMEK